MTDPSKVRVICGADTDEDLVFDEVARAYADKAVGTIVVQKHNARLLDNGLVRHVDLSKRPELPGGC